MVLDTSQTIAQLFGKKRAEMATVLILLETRHDFLPSANEMKEMKIGEIWELLKAEDQLRACTLPNDAEASTPV